MTALETSRGEQTRYGSARRFAWVGVLVGGIVAYLLVLHTLVSTQNTNFVPSLLLLGSIVVPITVLVFAASGGRHIVATTPQIVFTAVAGGLIGTIAAGTVEYDTSRGTWPGPGSPSPPSGASRPPLTRSERPVSPC